MCRLRTRKSEEIREGKNSEGGFYYSVIWGYKKHKFSQGTCTCIFNRENLKKQAYFNVVYICWKFSFHKND